MRDPLTIMSALMPSVNSHLIKPINNLGTLDRQFYRGKLGLRFNSTVH